MTDYRKGLPPRPPRMASLPLNEKGYPVPWFVDWPDGKPDFRYMDGAKYRRAIKARLCWLCGDTMGSYLTFVAGPMCGINRTSAEPPCHHDCAVYAAIACPFLTLPKALRREAGLTGEEKSVGGIALKRNPGVAMLWTTRSYRVVRVDNGYLIKMGEPTQVEWFCEGRAATREEVEESIRTGLPALEGIAREQEQEEGPGVGAIAELVRMTERFQPFLPAP